MKGCQPHMPLPEKVSWHGDAWTVGKRERIRTILNCVEEGQGVDIGSNSTANTLFHLDASHWVYSDLCQPNAYYILVFFSNFNALKYLQKDQVGQGILSHHADQGDRQFLSDLLNLEDQGGHQHPTKGKKQRLYF